MLDARTLGYVAICERRGRAFRSRMPLNSSDDRITRSQSVQRCGTTRAQAGADLHLVLERPDTALRRLAPDPEQLQVIIGSLLGDGRITGRVGRRQLSIAHQRHAYARWKYERLGAFAAGWPVRLADLTQFTTIAHPVFDDLAGIDRAGLLALTGPLGLAVWLTDLGRIELRLDSFLPSQQAALCAA